MNFIRLASQVYKRLAAGGLNPRRRAYGSAKHRDARTHLGRGSTVQTPCARSESDIRFTVRDGLGITHDHDAHQPPRARRAGEGGKLAPGLVGS